MSIYVFIQSWKSSRKQPLEYHVKQHMRLTHEHTEQHHKKHTHMNTKDFTWKPKREKSPIFVCYDVKYELLLYLHQSL